MPKKRAANAGAEELKRNKTDRVSSIDRCIPMATAALPIRELSANVQYDAARAQKVFWEVVESKRHNAYIQIQVLFLTHRLDRRMGKLAVSQASLVNHLRKIPLDSMSSVDFTKVADDLYRIVSMTDSLIDDAYEMPDHCLKVWRANLEKVSDLSSHLESFAESYRMASDEACTALLADLVQKIEARETIRS